MLLRKLSDIVLIVSILVAVVGGSQALACSACPELSEASVISSGGNPSSVPQQIRESIQTVFTLLESAGTEGYIGEPVSQLEHALQAAASAESEGQEPSVILGALFHDIGHLCASDEDARMGDLGVLSHDKVGANFLRKLGFDEDVALLVEGHVDAKRYRVAADANYRNQLSEASLQTLEYQGGPMTPEEKENFEKHRLFEKLLLIRKYDERAKVQGLKVPDIKHYQELAEAYLMNLVR